jgi:hypothetical protein
MGTPSTAAKMRNGGRAIVLFQFNIMKEFYKFFDGVVYAPTITTETKEPLDLFVQAGGFLLVGGGTGVPHSGQMPLIFPARK